MRRTLNLAVVCLLVGSTAIAGTQLTAPGTAAVADSAYGLPGIVVASHSDIADAELKVAPAAVNRPVALIETDYYFYPYSGGTITTPTVYLTLDDNDYADPVSLFLFWENRGTSERYYIANGEILDEGNVKDMFGFDGMSPMAIHAPAFDNLMLFGENSVYGAGPLNETGMYQFVVEIRDYTGATVIARSNAMYNHIDSIVVVEGDITEDTLWTNSNAYYLNSAPVYVGGNPFTATTAEATLTIEPGTMVVGSKANQGTLVVVREGELLANGTALMPIIFSSELTTGNRGPGDWGGLVLNGSAPVNPGEIEEGEGNSGPFGGDDPYDSSGVLCYVRVEFAGIRFSDQNELNGIAVQGVGAGTVIRNVQVTYNQDDGIEFFGGTVNAENVFITDAEDDSVDWVYGWQGHLSNVVVLQRSTDADNGIEADSWKEQPDAEPRSMPHINNATFIGNAHLSQDPGKGMNLRRGTAGLLRSFIVYNFGNVAVDVDDLETYNQIDNGSLQLTNSIFYNNNGLTGGDDPDAVEAWLTDPAHRNQFVDPMLADPLHPIVPDVAPLPGSPARDAAYTGPTDYIGGVDPNAPWIHEGWVTYADN